MIDVRQINLGIGLGLRTAHYDYIFEQQPDVDFFEIISENFMLNGGPALAHLERILDRYAVVQHGVSLAIASCDPLDFKYLAALKELTIKTKTPWFSDHLCWSRAHGVSYHDLLPVPYTEANARYIADRAKTVQDYIGLPFALENLSSYVSFKESTMPEWEFYSRICELADCYMMFDVNNVFVSSINHNFDPMDYLRGIPYNRVLQVHVAGHSVQNDGTLLDTHDHPVSDAVWELYRYVHQQTGGVSTILEWDDQFISFADTHAEALKAKHYMHKSMTA